MKFREQYNELCHTRGNAALRRLRDAYPGRNIRYILWQLEGEPWTYDQWINKMWKKFLQGTATTTPIVETPEMQVDFDNWLVDLITGLWNNAMLGLDQKENL